MQGRVPFSTLSPHYLQKKKHLLTKYSTRVNGTQGKVVTVDTLAGCKQANCHFSFERIYTFLNFLMLSVNPFRISNISVTLGEYLEQLQPGY